MKQPVPGILVALLITINVEAQTLYVPGGFSSSGIGANTTNTNVGIGTATPTSLLHVNSSTNTLLNIQSTSTGNNYTSLNLVNDSGTAFSAQGYGSGYSSTAIFDRTNSGAIYNTLVNGLSFAARHTSGYITFHTGGSNAAERMRIAPNGNVGIGTGTNGPYALLDVGGQLRMDKWNSFPVEGSISETNWGNYVIGDATNLQRLKLGVANDSFSRAEILLDNSNRPDGTIELKTANTNGGAITRMMINGAGSIGIGTTPGAEKLTVAGTIRAAEIRVESIPGGGPDFVFAETYKLDPLEAVEKYIRDHKHLPEIPSAAEMKDNGILLADMNMKLLQKIEELTLYLIELKKENAAQQNEIERIKSRIK